MSRLLQKYHPEKANTVTDALSKKSLHISWMMIQERKLVEDFYNLKLVVLLTPSPNIRMKSFNSS